MSAINEDDLFEILERLEGGDASPEDVSVASRLASGLSVEDMLHVDVFAGDESDVRVLDTKVVKGRIPHIDHYSGMPIPLGARHLVIREMCEGEFLTTRHSELSLWMLREGFDPSLLRKASADV